MSVAYQSWEVAAGPTVAYKVGGSQGNHCANEGSNYKRHPQQDSVIRGLSDLSLYVHPEADSEPSVVDSKDDDDDVVSKHKQEPMRQSLMSEGSTLPTCRTRSDTLQHQICNGVKPTLFAGGKSSLPVEYSLENNQIIRFQGMPDAIANYYQHLPALDVVSEDKPWENCPTENSLAEADSISSCSSISDDIEDSPCTSGDACQGVSVDMEAQSSFSGPLDSLSSLEVSLPMKRGLSRFFSGKSRSFSCLADVVSVKDLAKPENPYARKRKNNTNCSGSLERPKLHMFRNGGAGISKKPFHSNKSTLALAVAMSTKECIIEGDEHDCQILPGVSRSWQSRSAPSRSYSLSDLQRAGHQCSPGKAELL